MKAVIDPRIAAARVSRFCAAVIQRDYSRLRSMLSRLRSFAILDHSKHLLLQRLSIHLSTLLLIPLEDTVVFPTMDVTLPVDVGDDERVVLVPRHEGSFAEVGTIA